MTTQITNKFALLAGLLASAFCGKLRAADVQLQHPTATLSQRDGWNVGTAIDGVKDASAGWAVYNFSLGQARSETAVFETTMDVGYSGGSLLTFQLFHINHNLQHTLGRFRLSVTTDDRDTFADSLANGGDVTADWHILTPFETLATDNAILTAQYDGSVLASGPNPNHSIYTITAATSLEHITGIRLEVIEDPSLPFNGPGRFVGNGNFVLSEFQVAISPVPEPSVLVLLVCGGIALLAWKARRATP